MFELTKDENISMRSQIATSYQDGGRGGNRYLPFAFTENGVAMPSSVLKSETTIEVNICIMRAFAAIRSFMMNNAHMFQRLETIEHNYLLVHALLLDMTMSRQHRFALPCSTHCH